MNEEVSMNLNGLFKKQFLIWIGAVLCVLLLVNHPVAEAENAGAKSAQKIKIFKKMGNNFKNPSQVKIIATVMEVNTDEFYIVIAEKFFYVAEFKMNGETHRTELTDMDGKTVEMDAFAQGDRVEVTAIGLEPGKGIYVALTIKLLPPR